MRPIRAVLSTSFPLAILVVAAPAQAQTVGVASLGGGCTHFNLTTAIAAAAPGDTIYVEPFNSYAENLVIGQDLTISVGSPGCGPPGPTPTPDVVVLPAISQVPVVEVVAGTVELIGLQILGGTCNAALGCAGGQGANILVSTPDSLTLRASEVTYGRADQGGGVALVGCGSVTLADATVISDNEADLGGGIYVSGAGCAIPPTLRLESEVRGNAALQDGGGIYVESAALVLDSFPNVHDNRAANTGGGIYAKDSTVDIKSPKLTAVAEPLIPLDGARIEGNAAQSGDGGGLALFDSKLTAEQLVLASNRARMGSGGGIFGVDAIATMINSVIQGNEAGFDGGGIASLGDGLVSFRADFSSCAPAALPINRYCAELRQNRAGNGGALFAESVISLSLAALMNNRASIDGTALYLTNGVPGAQWMSALDTVLIEDDQFGTTAPPTIALRHPNHASSWEYSTLVGPWTVIDQGAGVQAFYDNSIIDWFPAPPGWVPPAPPPGAGLNLGAGAAASGLCNVQVAGAPIVPLAANLVAGAALSAAPALRNVPTAGSPAINLCGVGPLAPVDLRGVGRPIGLFDAGVFEQ